MFELTINNQRVTAREGETILEVAKRNHIQIPTLCHLEGIHQIAHFIFGDLAGAQGIVVGLSNLDNGILQAPDRLCNKALQSHCQQKGHEQSKCDDKKAGNKMQEC